jgi:hypothetical protein
MKTQWQEMHPTMVLPGDFFEKVANAPEPESRLAAEDEEPNPETDLVMYVIHNRLTLDHPGYYVMRRQWTRPGMRIIDPRAWLHHDIEPLRAKVPPGLYCLVRQPGDPFTIVETWL